MVEDDEGDIDPETVCHAYMNRWLHDDLMHEGVHSKPYLLADFLKAFRPVFRFPFLI